MLADMKLDRPSVILIAGLTARVDREVALGIATYARQHTDWSLSCQPDFTSADLHRARPTGIIRLGLDPAMNKVIHRAGIPLVLVAMPDYTAKSTFVVVDERQIGRMAAEYFVELGLKHFAYVGHGQWPFVAERRDYFAEALAARGFGPLLSHTGMFYDGRQRKRFMKNLETLLLRVPKPCGLLAANDALGVVIIETCSNLGLRVPDDIAVVGVDDDELACELSRIPLSSIVQPFLTIGYESARLLHQHMTNPKQPVTRLLLPPLKVRSRASSALIALDDADVVAALRLITSHLAESINVEWVVRQLPVARRSLERKFKKLVGRTILGQIHHVRLQKAKELLAESDLSLDTVAQRSGFANARWMADSFRRELRITPHRFRRQFRTEH